MSARPKPTHCDWCERPLIVQPLHHTGLDAARYISITTATAHGPNRITFQPYRVCSLNCAAEYFAEMRDANSEWNRDPALPNTSQEGADR